MAASSSSSNSLAEAPAVPESTRGHPLHEAVWRRDLREVSRLLRSGEGGPVNARDRRGNTPLHIAAHFGFGDVTFLLRKYGADVAYKNGGGFSAFQEAIAGGHTDVTLQLYFGEQLRAFQEMKQRAANLHTTLAALPDFSFELEWEFRSWVPLVSRFCPRDTYHIYKRGNTVRMDFSLVGMEGMSWVRADASLFFTGTDHERPGELLTINRTSKTLEWTADSLQFFESVALKPKLASWLHEPLQRTNTFPDAITFRRSSQWFSSGRPERVGGYSCQVFDILNFKMELTSRTESSKQMSKGGYPIRVAKTQQQDMPFEQYFDPSFSLPPNSKGTGMVWPSETVKKKTKAYTGKVWMTTEFPFTLQQFLPIVEALAPTSKHFQRLRSFLDSKLPDAGFPVSFDIPVFPTIAAKVIFKNLVLNPTFPPDFFSTASEFPVVRGSETNPDFELDPEAVLLMPPAPQIPSSSSSSSSSSSISQQQPKEEDEASAASEAEEEEEEEEGQPIMEDHDFPSSP